ncbi:MAG: hypothetical protein H6828_08620 [Planctomycetes bacterium]|nr:hypothetical protein [Planctomycetota bacterium]
MERIGVVGLNWKAGGPQRLAAFTVPLEERPARLRAMAAALGASELVYLATCNRVEVAFVSDDPRPCAHARPKLFRALTGAQPAPGEAERVLRAWQGEGAVEHLFLVAAGLDSAKLGESEISRQVREALELARGAELVGPRLELLFREALKLGKDARTQTALGEGRTSLAEIGLDAVRAALAKRRGPVALVGVSPMTERCAASLAQEGVELIVVNRTRERAEAFARTLGRAARALDLASFRADPPAVRALVSATGAPGALFGEPELVRLVAAAGAPAPVLVDFAVPPDVDPAVAARLGLERLGMEDVIAVAERNRAERLLEVGEARALVDDALATFGQRLAERAVDQAVRSLHQRYQAVADDQIERLLRAKLRDLDEADRDTLRRFVGRLVKHFAHVPTSGLREIARAHGAEAVGLFFAHAEDELRREVELALEEGDVFRALDTPQPEETPS